MIIRESVHVYFNMGESLFFFPIYPNKAKKFPNFVPDSVNLNEHEVKQCSIIHKFHFYGPINLHWIYLIKEISRAKSN
jgi:hypothetical protein